MSAALEQQVAMALVADTTSADLTALIAETEAAIIQADAAVSAERTKALDPVLSPDAKAAREAMAAAEFDRDRMKTLLPRLQARCQEVQAQEYLTQWRSDYEKLKVKRDGLAEELRTIYPEFETKITDVLTRIAPMMPGFLVCIRRVRVALRCTCLALNLWRAILSALRLRSRQSPKSLSCRHSPLASGWPGRRRSPPWRRCSQCRWCRRTTQVTRPIGQPRWKRTTPGGQRLRPGGPKRKPLGRRRADAHTRRACGDEAAFRRTLGKTRGPCSYQSRAFPRVGRLRGQNTEPKTGWRWHFAAVFPASGTPAARFFRLTARHIVA